MRSRKSLINMIVAVSGNMLNILITFISRTFFILILGTEYLGINGLFSNILTILSLAELGIGTAITYSLYKPLAENNIRKIRALMRFFQIVYRIIGIVIISLGIILIPFLEFFMSEVPEIDGLRLIFLLYVINTAVSYFFSYKRTLIIADQKQYIVSIYHYVFLIVQNILQISVLYLYKDFILYLLVQILITILHNVLISIKADNLYPFLKSQNKEKLDSETLSTIKKNTGAMVIHKIGTMVVNSTDNILISKMVGIIAVGLYSNYILIINAVNGLLGQAFSAITASIGNIGATESPGYLKTTFKRVLFFNFWIYGFCSISLYILINPFIKIWIGEEMLFAYSVVSVVILNFYLSGMRRTVLTFKDALGLFWYDRYKPIFESIVNLTVSIILTNMYGLVGIFIGTTISIITTSFWIEPLVLYKYGFKEKIMGLFQYLGLIIRYTLILLVVLVITLNITEKVDSLISDNTLYSFAIKILIVVTLPNLIFLIVFFKSEEFKWLVSIIINLKKKYLKKGEY